MPVQKIKSGRIITVDAPTYVGEKGTIFYDEDTPQLRLSDGLTPGGILFTGGGGYVLPAATTSTLGGIKVGSGLTIDLFGVLTAVATSTFVLTTATTSALGGVKIGSGLSITADGTLSAIATSTYVLTTATTTHLGGVKIGANVSITADGTISVAAPYVLNTATTTSLGGIKIGSGLVASSDGTVSAVATSTYVLTTATTSTLGGIKVGANLTIDPDGTLNANTATAGISDTFKTIKVNSQTDLVAVGNDVIEFKAGTGIIIETSATSTPYQSMTISATGFGNIDGGMFDTVFDTTTLIFDGGTP